MSAHLARLLVYLYPLAFRRRYGSELRALLDETEAPVRVGTLLDLLRGALSAHLRPPAGLAGGLHPGERLRASASAVLACWVAFAAAGFGFYKTTEDHAFEAAASSHTLLGGAHRGVQILAILGSLALLAGALPLIVAALRQARQRPDLRILVRLPAIAVFGFASLSALLVLLSHSHHADHASTIGKAAFIAWELAALGCGAVCVLASRRALFALGVARIWLLFALVCATCVAGAMTAIVLATGLYTIALQFDASSLAATPNGPLALTPTSVSLIEQLIVMSVAAILALLSTRRGWRSLGAQDAERG